MPIARRLPPCCAAKLAVSVVCSRPRPLCVRYLALALTVPDCRAPRLARLYPATAALATAWVGAASWFLLVWALKVRCPTLYPQSPRPQPSAAALHPARHPGLLWQSCLAPCSS